MSSTKEENRILYVLPTLDTGGAELNTIHQINYLHQQDHKVYLVICTKYVALLNDLKIPSTDVLIINRSFNKQFNYLGKSTIFLGWLIIPIIAKFIRRNKINKVIAVMDTSSYILRLLKLSRFIFFTNRFDLINCYQDVNYDTSPLNSISKRIFNQFHRFLAFLSDNKSILISNAVKENIEYNFFLRNPIIIPNSLPFIKVNKDLAKAYLAGFSINSGSFNIIFPGRLDRKKGHKFFIGAFKEFIEENKLMENDLKLIIAGGGNIYDEIYEEIISLSLEKYIHMTNSISNQLMLSLISEADLVVIPSIHEGLGNVTIEALMVGTLVLASDAGGLKEIITNGKNGYSFPSLQKQALKEKLLFIYNNRHKKLIPSSQLILDYQKRFTVERQVDKLLDFI